MHPAMHLIHREFTAAGASTLDQSDRAGSAGLCCETILERLTFVGVVIHRLHEVAEHASF